LPVGFISGVGKDGKKFTHGPYVFTDLGRVVAGPFGSIEAAEAWIAEGCDPEKKPALFIPDAEGNVRVSFLSAQRFDLTVEELSEEIVQIGGDRY